MESQQSQKPYKLSLGSPNVPLTPLGTEGAVVIIVIISIVLRVLYLYTETEREYSTGSGDFVCSAV